MSRLKISILISTMIHILIVSMILIRPVQRPTTISDAPLKFELYQKQTADQNPFNIQPKSEQKKLKSYKSETSTRRTVSKTVKEISHVSLTSFEKSLLEQSKVKADFIRPDSLQIIKNTMAGWIRQMSSDNVKCPSSDPADQFLYNQIHGHSVRASAMPPCEIKPKQHDPEFDFKPTQSQITLMRLLHQQNAPLNQSALYTLFPDSIPMTLAHMEQELEGLVKKGFLTKQKKVLKPPLRFFGIPLELDRISKKNPVFVYSPNVSEEKLRSYLQSVTDTQDENK